MLVELDEFYNEHAITFVNYREDVYECVKQGVTYRNAQGKIKQAGQDCAKASDWYNYYDSKVRR